MEIFREIASILSALAVPALLLFFLVYGAMKKVPVYETAVEGAKEGFTIAVKIIPYLVLMLVAIAVFRASGAMDVLISLAKPVTDFFGIPAETLPMAKSAPAGMRMKVCSASLRLSMPGILSARNSSA